MKGRRKSYRLLLPKTRDFFCPYFALAPKFDICSPVIRRRLEFRRAWSCTCQGQLPRFPNRVVVLSTRNQARAHARGSKSISSKFQGHVCTMTKPSSQLVDFTFFISTSSFHEQYQSSNWGFSCAVSESSDKTPSIIFLVTITLQNNSVGFSSSPRRWNVSSGRPIILTITKNQIVV